MTSPRPRQDDDVELSAALDGLDDETHMQPPAAEEDIANMSLDYGSMPMHFLAQGDDPPVIMIPEPADTSPPATPSLLPPSLLAATGQDADDEEDGEPPAAALPSKNYPCAQCAFATPCPRAYLAHLRGVHHERMQVYECPHCTYASRHSQKMQRHVSMVHDPARPDRRRPGPAPRRRDEYYDDFVEEMHKRQAARIVKKRQQQLMQQETNVAMAAMALAASAAAGAGGPRKTPPTCTVTSGSLREDATSDDDDEDRLVIDNDEDDQDDEQLQRDADPDQDGESAPARLSSVITSIGIIRDDQTAAQQRQLMQQLQLRPTSSAVGSLEDGRIQIRTSPPGSALAAAKPRAPRIEKDPVTRAYKCSSCDFTSRAPSLVARHESVVHLKKRFYRCSKCNYVTHIRARYTKHFKYHTMPLIKCDDCDFQSPYRWNLDRHVKNHGGLGRHRCRACNFAADIRQSLTVHEMNHHVPPVPPAPSSYDPTPMKKRQKATVQGAGVAAVVSSAAAAAASLFFGRGKKKQAAAAAAAETPGASADATSSPSSPPSSSSSASPAVPPVAPGVTGVVAGIRLPTHQTLRCSLCDFRTPFFVAMSRHMAGVHAKSVLPPMLKRSADPATSPPAPGGPTPGAPAPKRAAKPLPNLIPIQATPLGQNAPPPPRPPSASSTPAANGDEAQPPPPQAAETAKKKNSFFDQLRLYPGSAAGDGSELVCVHCGHEAKCTSELTRHNKLHQGTSRVQGTSTRCQHCRHRCKTSSDLAQHLKTCPKAAAAAALDPAGAPQEAPAEGGLDDRLTLADSDPVMESDIAAATEADNAVKVAVPQVAVVDDDDEEADAGPPPPDDSVPTADLALVGVETAPGYGLVTDLVAYEARAAKENVVTTSISMKKVFKCPHCTFWAATASRFHVHMVGHANKKPFACSICMYRSNWRWDITKHIRIKEAKDQSHANAKTLMTDDSGRRNYSKYNTHLLWLKVAEPSAENLTPLFQVNNPLPAPPKLTRAPVPRNVLTHSSSGTLLRPPPPLHAAAPHPTSQAAVRVGQSLLQPKPVQPVPQQQQAMKRPADTPVPKVGADPKKSNPEIKKTVWRCKQCHFRDGDRAVVLAHVKGHYRQQQEAFALAKMKNSQAGTAQAVVSKPQNPNENQQSVIKKVPIRCDICPFVSHSDSVMQSHVICHKERNDVLFKCPYCPFYVSSKEEVIQHMTVHQSSPKTDGKASSIGNGTLMSNKNEIQSHEIQVKKEVDLPEQDTSISISEEPQPTHQPPRAPVLDFTNVNEAPVCWVFRDQKLQKMLRCRYCPHVNLRKTNMQEHEKMHLKRDGVDGGGQYAPYPCPECSYVCNNAGVLSTHMKVHFATYPQAYTFYDPYRSEVLQMREITAKFNLKPKDGESPMKPSPPKEAVDAGNEKKLCGINVMSLLDPNQSLTDAVLAMKKKFNLELDGEPFAEPVEDSAESPPCSPLKQLNDGADLTASDVPEAKQLHFCNLCPARFLFRKELGIHSRFHNLHLVHKCDHCTYTARQRPHLQAHFKVHTGDYQERTNALMKMYQIHKDFSMPRIVCLNVKTGASGHVWIVVTPTECQEQTQPAPKFTCSKCPAAFFNNEAFQAHFTLHGSNNPHKCRICDYAVKTYGNLIKHMITHGCRRTVAKKIVQGEMEVPESLRRTVSDLTSPVEGPGPLRSTAENLTSVNYQEQLVVPKEETLSSDNAENQRDDGQVDVLPQEIPDDLEVKEDVDLDLDREYRTDSLEKSDREAKDKENSPSESPPSPKNSGFASGSPEFVYPTFCRNGRIKVKKYKCPKCPSAFEKRDQYLVHMSLHGSKQRYKCPKCDYSVKFFANHIQHLRRHQINDEAKETSRDDVEPNTNGSKDVAPEDSENIPSPSLPSPTRSAKTTGGNGEKLSVADKQAIMVLQQRRAKRAAVSRESLDKNYWCSHCPYSSARRDQVESHMRRHISVSCVRNTFVCDHCDYSVPTKHFLRDHSKLHFDVSKAPRPDAYMICNGLELYASSGFLGKNKAKGKVLIFQDKGPNATSDRFIPALPMDINDDSNDGTNRIYVNPKTFESESFGENGSKENLDTAGEVANHAEIDKECDGKLKDNFPELPGKESIDEGESQSSSVCNSPDFKKAGLGSAIED